MNYSLNTTKEEKENSMMSALRAFLPLLSDEKKNFIIVAFAIIFNAGFNLLGPLIVGETINTYIAGKDFQGVLINSLILLLVYIIAFIANLIQMRTIGGVGQRLLWKLRNAVFTKLQELPVAFFNQNKAGDLISRLNNDTDRLNQLFSQTLMQFTSSIFVIIGAAIFILVLNWKLALASLAPAIGLFIFTRILSPWVKDKNFLSLKAEGSLSAEIAESLENFKVVVAFNRRDYFRERFRLVNHDNFKTSVIASIGNGMYGPVFDFASNVAQLIAVAYGLYLVSQGQLLVGFIVSFLLYIGRFYDPLRQMASLWASMQVALAGWDRLNEIFRLQSDLVTVSHGETLKDQSKVIEFKEVSFEYQNGKKVLEKVSFGFEKGKTYALVGPTGGGKTTTASIVARLYDPTQGTVFLNGKDIRSYDNTERTKKIGFILQEPFLFLGTIRDNILYGNAEYQDFDSKKLSEILSSMNLNGLLERFEKGLDTEVSGSGDSMSLGQRQIIAFMRAVLRKPDILILDEATANIDTVTEKQLEEILEKLPKETTKVVIAHRLNTIENADEIYFVNGGQVTLAGSMEHAVEMLLHDHRQS